MTFLRIACTDMDDMLKNEQLDFVDIALPTYLHAEASIKAMEAGFHVLCEKPMALDSRQCQEMIAASQRTGRTLMIAHCLRFWPEYECLKAAVDDGRYGRVTSACAFQRRVHAQMVLSKLASAKGQERRVLARPAHT